MISRTIGRLVVNSLPKKVNQIPQNPSAIHASRFSSFSSSSGPKWQTQNPSLRYRLGLGLLAGSVATTLALLDDESRKKWIQQIEKLHQTLKLEKYTPLILDIPGMPQGEGAVHGVSTRELGNFGFVTVTDPSQAAEFSAGVAQGLEEVANFTRRKTSQTRVKKPLLILNETVYASAKAAGLQKDAQGQPQFIFSLTEKNIGDFIEKNRFAENSPFSILRDKCIRVPADGFVSNLGEFEDYDLYFAVNTADAAPIVLVDNSKGIIGIMPCSWHNLAKGEVEELIQKMIDLGAEPAKISMGIGPGLGPKSFEFSASDAVYFYQPGLIDKRDGRPFQARVSLQKHVHPHLKEAQKVFLDLPGMLKEIALERGLLSQQIYFDESWDSMTNFNFFSARRSTPKDERLAEAEKKYPKTARGINFIHSLSNTKQPKEKQVHPAITIGPNR